MDAGTTRDGGRSRFLRLSAPERVSGLGYRSPAAVLMPARRQWRVPPAPRLLRSSEAPLPAPLSAKDPAAAAGGGGEEAAEREEEKAEEAVALSAGRAGRVVLPPPPTPRFAAARPELSVSVVRTEEMARERRRQ